MKRLRKRGENSWAVVTSVYELRPEGGRKRKRKWIAFRTEHGLTERRAKIAAEKKAIEILNAINRDEFIATVKTTVAEWLAKWFDRSVKPLKRQNTVDAYSIVIKNHVTKAPLGAMPIQKVRPSDIEHYLNTLGRARATVGLHRTVLHSAFKKAKRDGLIANNPATDLELPKVDRNARQTNARKCWSPSEAQRFLAAAQDLGTQAIAFFSLALNIGARKNELFAIGWEHVNFDKGTITIERQLTSRKGEPVFGPTKTSDIRKDIALDKTTLDYLRAHKRSQAAIKMANRTTYQDHGLVFATEASDIRTSTVKLGEPMNGQLDQRYFDKATKAAGVPAITFHGLRHTCATLALTSGVSVLDTAKRLGHSTPMETLTVYAHALDETQAAAANKIGAAIHGGKA